MTLGLGRRSISKMNFRKAILFLCLDEYFESVMYENIERTTNTAYDFWKYIHISEINREEK